MSEPSKKRARRPHGTGSITLRKDGRYQGKYYINAKAHYVYADTRPTCNKLLLAAIKAGKQSLLQKPRILLKDYMVSWLEGRVDYRANSYKQRGDSIRNHINPALGDTWLDLLTRLQVQAFVAGLIAAGKAPATVRAIYEALSAALSSAVDDDLIDTSPCYRIKLPPKVKAEHTVLDLSQAQSLCREAEGWLATLFKLAIGTAMRKSELLALKWSDIDLTKGVITVRHNVAYLPKRKHVPGPPKTKTSARTIVLPAFCRDELKAHRVVQMATRNAWEQNDLVFPNRDGNYRTPSMINEYLDMIIVRVEIPRVTFHELRHSTVTILLAMGINIKAISELLGHSSITITLDLYAHLLPGTHMEAMRSYSEAWEQEDVKKGGEEDEKWA
jgi:integrase